jgi:hypothetical protein
MCCTLLLLWATITWRVGLAVAYGCMAKALAREDCGTCCGDTAPAATAGWQG